MHLFKVRCFVGLAATLLAWLGPALFCATLSAQLPPPDAHRPDLTVEGHVDFALPIWNGGVCPSGSKCPIGSGGGVGALVQWRFDSGWAIGPEYNLWLLDGRGVHELTSIHWLGISLKRIFSQNRLIHPILSVSLLGLLLGNPFGIKSGGGGVSLGGGIEVEVTAGLAFQVGVLVRLFATSKFVTPNDGVTRSGVFSPNMMLGLRAAFVWFPKPRSLQQRMPEQMPQ